MKILKLITKPVNIKALMLCTALIFCCINIFGQCKTWEKIFDIPSNLSDYSYAICNADSNNFFVAGSIRNQEILLMKINNCGDTTWALKFGNSNSVASCLASDDSGSCVLSGKYYNHEAFAIKVDSEGRILWNKSYGGEFVQIYEIKKTSDNCYLLCGRENTTKAIVVKIDSFGNLVWKRNYTSSFLKNFSSFVENNNNQYILTGWESSIPNGLSRVIFTILDNNGYILFDSSYSIAGSTGGQKIQKIGMNYIVSGTTDQNPRKTYFLKINNEGQIYFTKLFQTSSDELELLDMKVVNDNKFLFSISKDTNIANNYSKLLMTDSLGNILRYRNYISYSFNINDIMINNSNEYLLAGSIDQNTNTFHDTYIAKLDSQLYSQPPIGINCENIITLKNKVKIFPNPFNGLLKIEFLIDKGEKYNLEIYDVLGKLLLNFTGETKSENLVKMFVDITNFSSGVYFCKILINEKIYYISKILFIK